MADFTRCKMKEQPRDSDIKDKSNSAISKNIYRQSHCHSTHSLNL